MPLLLLGFVVGSALSWFIGRKLFFTGESNALGAESETESKEATTEAKKEALKGAARGVDAPLSQKSRVRLSVILGAFLGCLSPEITLVAGSALSLEFFAFATLQNIIFVIVALVSVGIFYGNGQIRWETVRDCSGAKTTADKSRASGLTSRRTRFF